MDGLGLDDGSGNTYSLRASVQHRFKSSTVKECIRAILKEKLANVQYIPNDMPQLTMSLSETIKDRLKEVGFDRYKMVVQVVIGEQRGEGVNMAARCFWDADNDSCAHNVFTNYFKLTPRHLRVCGGSKLLTFRQTVLSYTTSEDSLFCVVAAFGCFYY